MKIGKHTGIRANFKNHEGYFFETVFDRTFDNDDKRKGLNLFVYDKQFGHNGDTYFIHHKDEWDESLTDRCWWVWEKEVTFSKKIVL